MLRIGATATRNSPAGKTTEQPGEKCDKPVPETQPEPANKENVAELSGNSAPKPEEAKKPLEAAKDVSNSPTDPAQQAAQKEKESSELLGETSENSVSGATKSNIVKIKIKKVVDRASVGSSEKAQSSKMADTAARKESGTDKDVQSPESLPLVQTTPEPTKTVQAPPTQAEMSEGVASKTTEIAKSPIKQLSTTCSDTLEPLPGPSTETIGQTKVKSSSSGVETQQTSPLSSSEEKTPQTPVQSEIQKASSPQKPAPPKTSTDPLPPTAPTDIPQKPTDVPPQKSADDTVQEPAPQKTAPTEVPLQKTAEVPLQKALFPSEKAPSPIAPTTTPPQVAAPQIFSSAAVEPAVNVVKSVSESPSSEEMECGDHTANSPATEDKSSEDMDIIGIYRDDLAVPLPLSVETAPVLESDEQSELVLKSTDQPESSGTTAEDVDDSKQLLNVRTKNQPNVVESVDRTANGNVEPVDGTSRTVTRSRSSSKECEVTRTVTRPANYNEVIDLADDADFVTSPRLLKAVINCRPLAIPQHIQERFKARDETSDSDVTTPTEDLPTSSQIRIPLPQRIKDRYQPEEKSRKRKLGGKTPDSRKRSHRPEPVEEERCTPLVDKNSELNKSDKFYDVKRILLHATYGTTGVNLNHFRHFCNIFLKNWRFSKQFPASSNSRSKQVILNLLQKVIRELYENDMIDIRGPRDKLDVRKLVFEEVKGDNSKLFSQTPPTLTILITEELFNKYYSTESSASNSSSSSYNPVSKQPLSKSVRLGSSTEQWFKLKSELGLESSSEVAAILMHCYKAWGSVACGKCRRHMEVGMENKTGRALLNSESSICIVSCECGKSTSGGFMIECDSCHKWQHGVCVGVCKDNIPAQYSCRRCCNIRGSVTLSPENFPVEDNVSDTSVVSIDNTQMCSTDDSEPEIIELD